MNRVILINFRHYSLLFSIPGLNRHPIRELCVIDCLLMAARTISAISPTQAEEQEPAARYKRAFLTRQIHG